MRSGIKKISNIILTLLLLGISVYFTVRDIEISKLAAIFRTIEYSYAILPMPIILLSHFMRALRWRILLSPFTGAASITNLFSATMIGYFFNIILPRGGEIIRPYIYSKREKISYSSTFATIIVERFIDLVTLLLLVALAFALNSHKIVKAFPAEIRPENILYLSAMMLVVIFLGLYPPFVNFVLSRLIKPYSEKVYARLIDIFNKFRTGFAIIKSPSRYFRIVIESLVIWGLYSLPLYILFFAFDFQSSLNLGAEDALLLLIVSGIGVTIAPTPAGLGIYHFLISSAMVQLYGIDKEVALAYATVSHATSKVVELVIGGLFLYREDLSGFRNRKEMIENV